MKYVPRSIQNIFDRIEAFNESVTKEIFSSPLEKTFKVVIYASLTPETKKQPPLPQEGNGSSVDNYNFFNARSLSGHHDHLPKPESATSSEQYNRLRNAHFQAIQKKATDSRYPLTGDIWLATSTGGNLVTLVSFEREGSLRFDFKNEDGGPAQGAHKNSNEPTQTNADYTKSDLRGTASEPTTGFMHDGIISEEFPYFNVDYDTNVELLQFIAKGEAINGSYNSANRIWYPNGQGGGFKLNTWPKDGTTEFLIDGNTLEYSTIQRIMDLQSPYHTTRYPTSEPPSALFATGRYQVIPETMTNYLTETGLTGGDLFSDLNQDRFALTLIYGTKRPALRDYLLGVGGVTLNEAQTNFAQEWSSVPTPDGTSYYGNENAGHNNQETRNLLERVRKANLLIRGADPDEPGTSEVE